MSQTTHPGTATTHPPGAAPPHAPTAAPAPPQTELPPAPVGMKHIVEVIGKGGSDADIDTLLAQQMRWDYEDVQLLFDTLRGKKTTTTPAAPGAHPEGARAR